MSGGTGIPGSSSQAGQLSHQQGRVILHLHIRTSDEKREVLLNFLHEAVPFYEEPGGIRVRLFQQVNDRNRFIEVIEYADLKTYEHDQARVASDQRMQGYLERWRELLDGPVEDTVYEDITYVIQAQAER